MMVDIIGLSKLRKPDAGDVWCVTSGQFTQELPKTDLDRQV